MTTKTRYERLLEEKAWAAHTAALDLTAHLAVREPEHAARCAEFAGWIEQRLGLHDDIEPAAEPAAPRF